MIFRSWSSQIGKWSATLQMAAARKCVCCAWINGPVKPFIATITQGILETTEAPPEFQNILEKIRGDESVIVREFGLGLNEAMSKHRIVSDITAFERQKGLHLSLGEKHATYNKPGMNRKSGRFHVDIFIDVTKITVDDTVIYQNGDFTV